MKVIYIIPHIGYLIHRRKQKLFKTKIIESQILISSFCHQFLFFFWCRDPLTVNLIFHCVWNIQKGSFLIIKKTFRDFEDLEPFWSSQIRKIYFFNYICMYDTTVMPCILYPSLNSELPWLVEISRGSYWNTQKLSKTEVPKLFKSIAPLI